MADWVLGWLRMIGRGEIIPPFCVELVLKDNSRHYLHSVIDVNDETKTLLVRIWDLRALRPEDIEDVKQRLNNLRDRRELADAARVHPRLDWANLHLHFGEVAHCVEWHDRLWPSEARPQIGFTP